MPPRTALDPSVLADSLTQSFSLPALSFQLVTVAPYRRISTLSPVGSTADTRWLPWEMFTCACGARPGVLASALGLLGLSTIVRGPLVWYCCLFGFCPLALALALLSAAESGG